MPTWLSQHDDGHCLLTLWVVPGSSRTEVSGEHGDALKVKVAAPPEAGKANKAVLELVSQLTGARATLESGTSSRRKIVRVHTSALGSIESSLLTGRKPDARRQTPDR